MTHVLSFIRNGAGYGIKLTLLFAGAIAVAVMGIAGLFLQDWIAQTEEHPLFRQLPTLIITPEGLSDSTKPFTYTDAQSGISLMIDPQLSPDEATKDNTIYLTRHHMVVRLEGASPTTFDLPRENIIITPQTIRDSLTTTAVFIPLLLGVWVGLWVVLGFLLSWGLTGMLSKLIYRPYPTDVIGRAVAFSWGSIILVDIFMVLAGYGFSLAAAVLFTVALGLILLRGLPSVSQ